jgi:hypothetical protein
MHWARFSIDAMRVRMVTELGITSLEWQAHLIDNVPQIPYELRRLAEEYDRHTRDLRERERQDLELRDRERRNVERTLNLETASAASTVNSGAVNAKSSTGAGTMNVRRSASAKIVDSGRSVRVGNLNVGSEIQEQRNRREREAACK